MSSGPTTESSSTATRPPARPEERPAIRPLYATLPHRKKDAYAYRAPESQVDHLVIGGGIVGLSIAAALSKRWPEKTTVLVERNREGGKETSSRGSKVVHAGIYYPPDSLKTRLCLRGKHLLYEYCRTHDLPIQNTGKLVVGPATESAKTYLESLHAHAQSLHPLTPPTRVLTGDEARELEPHLSTEHVGWALLSESTGIVGAADVVRHLHSQISGSPAGELVLGTSVVRVDPHAEDAPSSSGSVNTLSKRGSDSSQSGWVVQTASTVIDQTSGLAAPPTDDFVRSLPEGGAAVDGPSDSILARVVINASGLNGNAVLNSLIEDGALPGEDANEGKGIPMYYAKGNYVRSEGAEKLGIKHLIYPMPDMGQQGGKHAHQGLGTHLTLDMAGNIIFGPDVEWISPPTETSTQGPKAAIDFWSEHLTPTLTRLSDMHTAITSYLPAITRDSLRPAWAGIRPKLVGPGAKEFRDFEVLWHSSRNLKGQKVWQRALEDGFEVGPEGQVRPRQPSNTADTASTSASGGAMISLLGIESPGLTSSMAIAELVEELIAQRVWGDHNGDGRRSVKGAQNEEIGNLDDWA